jgi:hypothetical protein
MSPSVHPVMGSPGIAKPPMRRTGWRPALGGQAPTGAVFSTLEGMAVMPLCWVPSWAFVLDWGMISH